MAVLHIEENELKQPIGEKFSPLQSRLGMLARNGTMAPINWHKWSVVSKECKEIIWDEIKENKKNNGKKMSRIQFFKVVHSKKYGRPVTDVVAQALSFMQSSFAVEEVFTQVMRPEQPGCVRIYDFGPSLRDVFGHKNSE
ncbi:unnamed protein product [Ilex paraguariensis]|uniref:Uncharacterized protein n=1 Tax=Ilex paraguariensis TaxID=185542 RepID=A0ABC8SVW8_9AQUA